MELQDKIWAAIFAIIFGSGFLYILAQLFDLEFI